MQINLQISDNYCNFAADFDLFDMKNKLLLLLLALACSLSALCDNYVSPTRYDYSQVARTLTQGCTTQLQQARAIYDWICENISYDTNYSIYTADGCWDNRKGVCQAYSELFYRLCEPLGIRCIIISGIAKQWTGNVSGSGHAWIYAEVDDGAILLDPTWGAGYVNGNVFSFRDDHDYWFQVDPYWMIFTHFPKEEKFQFIDNPISESTFRSLPSLRPDCRYLGWNAQDIFYRCLSREIQSMPMIWPEYGKKLALKKIPMQKTLYSTSTYHFEVQKRADCKFALFTDNGYFPEDKWTYSNGVYSLDLAPGDCTELSISVKEGNTNTYTTMLSYEVK